MIIKENICLGNELCPSCGRQLSKMKKLVTVMTAVGDTLICEGCFKVSVLKCEQSFAVFEGNAYPLLDDALYRKITDNCAKTVFCSNVKERKGRLSVSGTEDNAVIVIELPDKVKRDLPQYALINSDHDLKVQTTFAQRINQKVLVRDARSSNRRFVFFKTDSPEETLLMMGEIRDAIRDTVFQKGGTVYMERIAGDTNDIGKQLLAELDCSCVYYDGILRIVEADRRFCIDFTVKELFSYCRSRIIGQDEQLRKAVFLIMDFIEKVSCGSLESAANWILTAPSGSGKTEFFRAVKDFFKLHGIPVPVLCEDLSQLTETGFKGKESGSIIDHISKVTNSEIGNAAICFLDEADKKMVPSFDGKGNNCNEYAQGNLLCMLDGSIAEYGKESKLFDTSQTMFVLLGAFRQVRDEKRVFAEMLDEIGKDDVPRECASEDRFYGDITIEEMIRFGMRDELAGRLKTVVNFNKPDHESMKAIIRGKCEMLAREYRCNTSITEEGVEDFMKVAYTSVGIRGVTNTMTDLLIKKLAGNISAEEFDREHDILIIEGTESISVKKHEEDLLPF